MANTYRLPCLLRRWLEAVERPAGLSGLAPEEWQTAGSLRVGFEPQPVPAAGLCKAVLLSDASLCADAPGKS